MDDATTPQVSGQSGDADLPSPTFSDQATSSPSVDADAIVSKVIAQLGPMIEKQVQSTKDKRFSEIEKALTGRGRLLAELEEQGVPITKEVRAEMRIRELEERLTQSPAQPAQPPVDGSTGQKAAVTDAIAKLTQYGLSSNDPAFIEVLRGSYTNKDAFDKAVYAHIVTKLAPQKPADPAGVVQPPATAGATARSVETLKAEYVKEMTAVRGSKAAGKAVIEKYQKLGLDTGTVDFRF